MKAAQRVPALSIAHLWPLATLALIFFFLSTHPIRPHDFWWHLRAGQEIVTTHRIPDTDTFSYTMAGARYASYASFWIVESAYYLLYSLGGLPLLIFLHAVVVTAAYGLLLWLCRAVSGSWRIAAGATFFAALLGFNDWNLRPQGIAFLLGSLCLWAVYAHRRQARRWLLGIFPSAMLLWANSHASYVVGLLLLAIWLLDEAWNAMRTRLVERNRGAAQRLGPPALALATAALACLINPRGPGIVAYLQSLAGNPVIRNLVTEWAPPSLRTSSGALFLAGLLLAATLLAISPRRPDLFQILSFLVFAILGFQGVRFAAWFGMVMAPVVAGHLAGVVARAGKEAIPSEGAPGGEAASGSRRSPGRGYPTLNWILAGILLAGAVLSTPWLKNLLPLPPIRAGLVSAETPVEATRVLLRERPAGHLFHELGFGSYLIWAAPEYPVFVDGRIELYPPEVWRDYLEISAAGAGWEQRLEAYGVNTLMLSPAEQGTLMEAAARSPDWRLIHQDPAAALFERARGSP